MATKTVITYGEGGFDPTKPNNNIVETNDVEIPDEHVVLDEARQALQQHIDPNQPDLEPDVVQRALATVLVGGLAPSLPGEAPDAEQPDS